MTAETYNTVNFEERKHRVTSNSRAARMRMHILIFAPSRNRVFLTSRRTCIFLVLKDDTILFACLFCLCLEINDPYTVLGQQKS